MSARAKVLVVVGTRPEGIKLAPVISGLGSHGDAVETRVALTGQHTDLLDQVLETFKLPVDWDLGIMREGQSLYDVAQGCLLGLKRIVREYDPAMLVVQGDTGTVLFGALVAYFERTRVAHVEAGLRSGDKWRPYPEELYRRLADAAADLHFAPTAAARDNLLREGIPAESIHVTGNTVVDALLRLAAADRPVRDAALKEALEGGKRLVLVTAHRRESFGAPLRGALGAVRRLADRYDDTVFLYPVHPNPEVRSAVDDTLRGRSRVVLTTPLSYGDLVRALREAVIVVTDSGGIQEEAPTFGTPVLVMRDVTERPEGVRAGVARLVGTDPDLIVASAAELLDDEAARRRMSAASNPYGDGRAGERIADILANDLTGRSRRTTDWEPS